MRRLQPFVVSTHLVEELMAATSAVAGADVALPGRPPVPTTAANANVATPNAAATFAALCREVLQTDFGALVAANALLPLVPQPLVYPTGAPPPALPPTLPAGANDLPVVAVADPSLPQVAWAVVLHGARQPIGVLLLGARRGDGLYTEEEIAIARATGERLLDLLATAAIAQRLLALTREQWAEGQVADRQARRVLHDEVLPDLHAALILLDSTEGTAQAQVKELLAGTHRQTATLLRALPSRPPTRPTGQLVPDLRRLVAEEMAWHFDTVHFAATDDAQSLAARVSPLGAEVIFYAVRELIRNAARHGRSQGHRPLTLTVTVAGGALLTITVQDDGAGLNQDSSATVGSSQGLDLHRAMLAVVGAALELEPAPGGGVCAAILVAH